MKYKPETQFYVTLIVNFLTFDTLTNKCTH